MKTLPIFTVVTLMLAGCSQVPGANYFDRGSPYSLLDASSEVVNVALTSDASVDEVVQWIDQDQPTQAELSCLESNPVCTKTMQTLEMFRVPVQFISSSENNLVLTYDRVVARDCENRYIDNPINPYNLNHPTFGCSTSVNMVQMVGDKRQFTSPSLLDFRDGENAVQGYEAYLTPQSSVNQKSQNLKTEETKGQ